MKKILSLFIIVFMLFTSVAPVHAKPKPKIIVRVPNVIGMTAASAAGVLQRAGLGSATKKIEVPGKKADTVAKIFIGSQQISAGKIVKRGTTITLGVVGRGTHKKAAGRDKKIKVPNLKGLTVKSGRNALERKKLRLGRVSEKQSSKDTVGTIIDQSPKSGKTVSSKTPVNVVIAQAVLIEVPNLVGKSEKNATRILTANRLKIGRITERRSPGRVAGSVLSQKPTSKSRVEKNSRVDLVIVAQEEVRLPNVVGLDLKKAETILKQHGFRVTTEYECCPGEFNPNLPVGKVVKIKAIKGKLVKGMVLTLLVPKPMNPGIGGGSPPDLIINNVINVESPDTQRLYEPYSVALTIIAENIGGLSTGPFSVRWYPHKNSREEPGCEMRDDVGLEPGQTRDFICNTYVYSTYGNMHWMAIADEQGEVENENRGNNRFYGEVRVKREDKPDLVITEAHYEQQQESVTTLKSGKRFKAVFTVKNQGNTVADPFTVNWRFENGIGLDNCCFKEIKKNLGPGSQMTKEFRDLTAPLITQSDLEHFSAIVDVDPENVVNEGHAEDNNEFEKSFYVKQEPPESVSNLHVCGQDVQAPGWDKIALFLCWDDQSDNEDGFRVEARTTIPTLLDRTEMYPDEESYVLMDCSCDTTYDFTVYAFNEAGTSDPVNLRTTTSSCDKFDLVVSTLTATKQNDEPGTYDIDFEISNRNRAPNLGESEVFQIAIQYPYCRQGERLVKTDVEYKFINADNQVVGYRGASDTTKIKARCLSGTEEIKVTVDMQNDVEEVNETNNEKTTTLRFQ